MKRLSLVLSLTNLHGPIFGRAPWMPLLRLAPRLHTSRARNDSHRNRIDNERGACSIGCGGVDDVFFSLAQTAMDVHVCYPHV